MPRPPDALNPWLAVFVLLMAGLFLSFVAGCSGPGKSTDLLNPADMVKGYPVARGVLPGGFIDVTRYHNEDAACYEVREYGRLVVLACSVRTPSGPAWRCYPGQPVTCEDAFSAAAAIYNNAGKRRDKSKET